MKPGKVSCCIAVIHKKESGPQQGRIIPWKLKTNAQGASNYIQKPWKESCVEQLNGSLQDSSKNIA